MKKLPLALIPFALIVIVMLVFALIIPQGGDLISASGDGVLGGILSMAFIACAVIDIKRYRERKRNSISNS
ncbi:MAG: hypothetical protein U0522_03425 [Candidatus Paceibacterota bacterium]